MPTSGYTHGNGRVSVFDPTLSTGYTTGLWRTCPLWEYHFDPSIGFMWEGRWDEYDAEATNGEWVLTQSTTGAAAISTAAPGVLELDSNSTTVVQGATLQHNKAVFVPAAGKHIWAEFNVKVVDTVDKVEFFVGLSELDTTLIAASANSSANHIGWQSVTDDGVLLFSAEKAGTGATKAATTLVEATYVKLGFYVNGVTEVEQYVNNVLVGTNHVTANIPIVALYPSFVCQSAGTNDPIMHIGACRVFQLR
jgi:hypothetical protein